MTTSEDYCNDNEVKKNIEQITKTLEKQIEDKDW